MAGKWSFAESTSYYVQGPPAIRPFVLENVQDTPLQLLCVAVKRNVWVPTAELTVTPEVGLNPGAAVEFMGVAAL